jgi:small acid-soluble spore protein P (minor)
MSKPKTQSVPQPDMPQNAHDQEGDNRQQNEPLSGSKKVKNRNHTRHNNAEG